jgi:hypothetical protein
LPSLFWQAKRLPIGEVPTSFATSCSPIVARDDEVLRVNDAKPPSPTDGASFGAPTLPHAKARLKALGEISARRGREGRGYLAGRAGQPGQITQQLKFVLREDAESSNREGMTLLILAFLAAIAIALQAWVWFAIVVGIALLFALIKIGSWSFGG